MKKYSIDNPVHDMGNAVTEFYKVADIAEIIIEAIFNGDDVTLQTVGNSMDVFFSQLRELENSEPYGNALAFVKLLPREQKEKLCNMLKEERVASHKKGFIGGYRTAASEYDTFCKESFEYQGFCVYAGSVDKELARKFVKKTGSVVRIGRRVFVSRIRFDSLCDCSI